MRTVLRESDPQIVWEVGEDADRTTLIYRDGEVIASEDRHEWARLGREAIRLLDMTSAINHATIVIVGLGTAILPRLLSDNPKIELTIVELHPEIVEMVRTQFRQATQWKMIVGDSDEVVPGLEYHAIVDDRFPMRSD